MTKEELDFIGSMNECDEISNEAYSKISAHCEIDECDDCISRQAALKEIKEWRNTEFVKMTNPYHYLEKRISNLPSASPINGMCKDCSFVEEINENTLWCVCIHSYPESDFYCKYFKGKEK